MASISTGSEKLFFPENIEKVVFALYHIDTGWFIM